LPGTGPRGEAPRRPLRRPTSDERKPGERLPRPESFDAKDKPVVVLTAKRAKG
jgi:hypothetical protein